MTNSTSVQHPPPPHQQLPKVQRRQQQQLEVLCHATAVGTGKNTKDRGVVE